MLRRIGNLDSLFNVGFQHLMRNNCHSLLGGINNQPSISPVFIGKYSFGIIIKLRIAISPLHQMTIFSSGNFLIMKEVIW
ncbi:Uncharacterised protein [Cardiobacterium valvarum]|uniref:Uncharacterized protein n=1 Tax=Cardiobacterium valvarum TaxID=194702 RepID=A0A381E398_9GAMM|nr:Uncharacterised protein [Cardiobacterium valvarum]